MDAHTTDVAAAHDLSIASVLRSFVHIILSVGGDPPEMRAFLLLLMRVCGKDSYVSTGDGEWRGAPRNITSHQKGMRTHAFVAIESQHDGATFRFSLPVCWSGCGPSVYRAESALFHAMLPSSLGAL